MAENIVNGYSHTVAGTAQSIAEDVAEKMTGDIIGTWGKLQKY
jgi:hypothetical protein